MLMADTQLNIPETVVTVAHKLDEADMFGHKMDETSHVQPWGEETARFDRKLNSMVPLIDELINNVQRLNGEFEKFKLDLQNLTRKTEEQRKRQKQMSVTLVKLDTDVDAQMKV